MELNEYGYYIKKYNDEMERYIKKLTDYNKGEKVSFKVIKALAEEVAYNAEIVCFLTDEYNKAEISVGGMPCEGECEVEK